MIPPVRIVERLNSEGIALYRLPFGLSQSFILIAALPLDGVSPLYDAPGVSIRHLRPPLGDSVLFTALHLPSKLHLSAEEQALLASRVMRQIERCEQEVGHQRTVVIGDFNMNPFETGLVNSEGFHAMMSRDIVEKGSRVVSGGRRHFFYNPMWSLMGDCSAGPPGTYYYAGSSPMTLFWNTFDQVLLRPDLATRFRPGDVRVLDVNGDTALLTRHGVPRREISDHLPISLTLQLEGVADGDQEPLGSAARER